MKKLYILDVSGYIFRAYFALPAMSSPTGEATHGLFGFIRTLTKLIEDFGVEHIVAVFDGPDNKKQRTEIYEKYKANRVRLHEDLPEQIDRARQFCELYGIAHIEVPGVEADDTMGSIATWAAKKGAQVYLCTSDKDLCQLVGENVSVLNTWKDNLLVDAKKVEELYGVPPHQIIDLLAIMGDSSDNIPGLKGFGPKTGVALLKEFGTLDYLLEHPEEVKGAKKQETLKKEREIALMSRRLATIHIDIPFPEEKSFFKLGKPDFPTLKAFFLELGLSSLAKKIDAKLQASQPPEKLNYRLVDSEEDLATFLTLLQSQKEVAFDTETTSLSPLKAEPVGLGFSFEEQTGFYIPLGGVLGKARVLEAVAPLFANPKIGFYAHNAKYDLHVLRNVGIEVANLCFDTLLAAYLLQSGSRRLSLDALSLHHFGKVKTSIHELIGKGKKEISMSEVPLEQVSDYCCEDVDYTFRLKKVLEKELAKRKLDRILFDIELPLTRILFEMERAGMYLDAPQLEEFAKELAVQLADLEEHIYELAKERFNLNSPKQLSVILFEKLGIKPLKKTTTGYSTRADVLETLAVEHPIAEQILAYRSLEKLRSTYVETLPTQINPRTHRVHPSFSQFIAATGRLACQDPNLQNIPVRTKPGRRIRAAFQPQRPGWSYLSADYSQIELRLLAHLCEDPALIEAFNQGEDIHSATAARVFGVSLKEVTKEERFRAKAINFGIIYGQQAYGLSRELAVSMKEAASFIEAYFARYPKVREYIEGSIEEARKTGRARTMIGREREIPEILSSNASMRAAAERLAMNTPLQGSAADLIKLAMLEVDKRLKEKGLESFLVLQVHDELIFEVPENELPLLKPLVKEAMEGVFSLKVPLLVDISIGKNWAEC